MGKKRLGNKDLIFTPVGFVTYHLKYHFLIR